MWKRLSVLWAVLHGDARLIWRALKHPGAPGWLKPAALLMVFYVLWPMDLIPDVIPLLGAMDDIVLVPLALRYCSSACRRRFAPTLRTRPPPDQRPNRDQMETKRDGGGARRRRRAAAA